jgi:hypothetical protein
MNGEAAHERTEVPVACKWSALSAVQQERQRALYRRLCCPFFEFGITVERDGGPVWLRMRGEGEAKRLLEAETGLGV